MPWPSRSSNGKPAPTARAEPVSRTHLVERVEVGFRQRVTEAERGPSHIEQDAPAWRSCLVDEDGFPRDEDEVERARLPVALHPRASRTCPRRQSPPTACPIRQSQPGALWC